MYMSIYLCNGCNILSLTIAIFARTIFFFFLQSYQVDYILFVGKCSCIFNFYISGCVFRFLIPTLRPSDQVSITFLPLQSSCVAFWRFPPRVEQNFFACYSFTSTVIYFVVITESCFSQRSEFWVAHLSIGVHFPETQICQDQKVAHF